MTLGNALSEKTLPLELLNASRALAHKIQESFDNLSPRDIAIPALESFLEKASQERWRLVVRSTGKEDTDKLANAGGNRSELNVSPKLRSVLHSIGSVIASYFEEKSLSQRTLAGDQSIFDLPLTPVLVQRMVGEQLGGVKNPKLIPSGCVVYTVEPAAYAPNQTNGPKNITTLQCSFGSNEGVVQSLVPLDTFYVEENGSIKSLIKDKFKRIIPVKNESKFSLAQTQNPSSLQKEPSLNKDTILAVSNASRKIDTFYKKRMDIELVYIPQEQTIYIVQARPLVFKPRKDQPSFIANPKEFKLEDTLSFISIIPGDSSVQKITSKDQILIEPTLKDALDTYTKADKNFKSKIIAIFAEKEVDTTSHEAAVFRGDGKIVVQSRLNEKLESWLHESDVDILLDVQRGLVFDLSKSDFAGQNLEELFTKQEIKYGWVNYPLPMMVSVGLSQDEDYCVAEKLKDEDCKNLGFENPIREFEQQIQEMREKAECQESQSGCLEGKLLAQTEIEKMEKLYAHAHALLLETSTKIANNKSELDVLFSKRFLESILYQEPSEELRDAYSFKSIQEDITNKKWILDEMILPKVKSKVISDSILKNPIAFNLAFEGLRASYSETTGTLWIKLLDTLQAAQLDQVTSFVQQMKDLNILEDWINTKKDDQHLTWTHIEQSQKTFHESEKYLGILRKKLKNLKAFSLSRWENPDDYAKNRKEYDEEFTKYFTSNEFLETQTSMELYAKISAMEEFVFLFDMTGKTLRGASKFYASKSSLVKNFKELVKSYLSILVSWVARTPSIKVPSRSSAPDFVSMIERDFRNVIYSSSDDEIHLYPSADFSVMAIALGAPNSWFTYYPRVAEDFFTFSHQSCNAIINYLIQEEMAPFQSIPNKMTELSNDILKFWDTVKQTTHQTSREKLETQFYMPLGRAHQALLTLSYFRKEKSFDFNLNYESGYISSKINELAMTAYLWSSFHKIPILTETKRSGISFSLNKIQNIPKDTLKDFVVSLNRVTFTHHTELANDFLQTVPLSKKVLKVLEGKDLSDKEDLGEIHALSEQQLLSADREQNKVGLMLFSLLKASSQRTEFYLKHLKLLNTTAQRVSKDKYLKDVGLKILEKTNKILIAVERYGKDVDTSTFREKALMGSSMTDYTFLFEIDYYDGYSSLDLRMSDLIIRIFTKGNAEDREALFAKSDELAYCLNNTLLTNEQVEAIRKILQKSFHWKLFKKLEDPKWVDKEIITAILNLFKIADAEDRRDIAYMLYYKTEGLFKNKLDYKEIDSFLSENIKPESIRDYYDFVTVKYFISLQAEAKHFEFMESFVQKISSNQDHENFKSLSLIILKHLLENKRFKAADEFFSQYCVQNPKTMPENCLSILGYLFDERSMHQKTVLKLFKEDLKAYSLNPYSDYPLLQNIMMYHYNEDVEKEILVLLKENLSDDSTPLIRIDTLTVSSYQNVFELFKKKGGEYLSSIETLMMKFVTGERQAEADTVLSFMDKFYDTFADNDKYYDTVVHLISVALKLDRLNVLKLSDMRLDERFTYWLRQDERVPAYLKYIEIYSELKIKKLKLSKDQRKFFDSIYNDMGKLYSSTKKEYENFAEETLIKAGVLSSPNRSLISTVSSLFDPLFKNEKLNDIRFALNIYDFTHIFSKNFEKMKTILDAVDARLLSLGIHDKNLEDLMKHLREGKSAYTHDIE
jgi:hypothetical protein